MSQPGEVEKLPATFTRRIRELYGDAGQSWLAALPDHLARLAGRWSLTLAPPFSNLTYNYVAPGVMADGMAVVLKVGVPNRELTTEIAALDHFAGRGAARLLRADGAAGALLLERLRPGRSLLTEPDDDAATRRAAGVMARLWRPPPAGHAFPTIADWAGCFARLRQRFEGGTGPLDAELVATAEGLFADLLPTMAAPVLLHGDLHHDNILDGGRRGWLAIDPKGVIGEPAYEVGAWLRNPLPALLTRPDATAVLNRRTATLAERLDLDPARLRAWGAAQAVLSACWTVEDNGRDWAPALAVARRLLAD